MDQFARTQLLLGVDAMNKLKNSRVAVFGVGGVGGYSVEALARSGVGAVDLIDDDKVCLTNINRQIIADVKTIGKYKVDVAKDRILSINPRCKVTTHQCFYLPENAGDFDFKEYYKNTDEINIEDLKRNALNSFLTTANKVEKNILKGKIAKSNFKIIGYFHDYKKNKKVKKILDELQEKEMITLEELEVLKEEFKKYNEEFWEKERK